LLSNEGEDTGHEPEGVTCDVERGVKPLDGPTEEELLGHRTRSEDLLPIASEGAPLTTQSDRVRHKHESEKRASAHRQRQMIIHLYSL
jgi:hypothetical protein